MLISQRHAISNGTSTFDTHHRAVNANFPSNIYFYSDTISQKPLGACLVRVNIILYSTEAAQSNSIIMEKTDYIDVALDHSDTYSSL